MLYPAKKTLKISRAIVQETSKILSATKICKFQELQVSTKLQVIRFYIKVNCRVVNYELNLELQFRKTFAESNFETSSF